MAGTPANPVTNPVNGVELAKVPKMSTAEATQAVEAAERAFPAWAKLTAKQRSIFAQMVRPHYRQSRRPA
jgi:succinate-semialdehyde dehydrogenase/glutarate-semialdehyde dehydrogenase